MTIYLYCNETGQYLGQVEGLDNVACELKVSQVYGTNDVTATYTAPRALEAWTGSVLGTVKTPSWLSE